VSVDEVPTNLYSAADWLRYRHPWLEDLTRRIAGDRDDWLDEIGGAVLDTVDNGAEWQAVRAGTPRPGPPGRRGRVLPVGGRGPEEHYPRHRVCRHVQR